MIFCFSFLQSIVKLQNMVKRVSQSLFHNQYKVSGHARTLEVQITICHNADDDIYESNWLNQFAIDDVTYFFLPLSSQTLVSSTSDPSGSSVNESRNKQVRDNRQTLTVKLSFFKHRVNNKNRLIGCWTTNSCVDMPSLLF